MEWRIINSFLLFLCVAVGCQAGKIQGGVGDDSIQNIPEVRETTPVTFINQTETVEGRESGESNSSNSKGDLQGTVTTVTNATRNEESISDETGNNDGVTIPQREVMGFVMDMVKSCLSMFGMSSERVDVIRPEHALKKKNDLIVHGANHKSPFVQYMASLERMVQTGIDILDEQSLKDFPKQQLKNDNKTVETSSVDNIEGQNNHTTENAVSSGNTAGNIEGQNNHTTENAVSSGNTAGNIEGQNNHTTENAVSSGNTADNIDSEDMKVSIEDTIDNQEGRSDHEENDSDLANSDSNGQNEEGSVNISTENAFDDSKFSEGTEGDDHRQEQNKPEKLIEENYFECKGDNCTGNMSQNANEENTPSPNEDQNQPTKIDALPDIDSNPSENHGDLEDKENVEDEIYSVGGDTNDHPILTAESDNVQEEAQDNDPEPHKEFLGIKRKLFKSKFFKRHDSDSKKKHKKAHKKSLKKKVDRQCDEFEKDKLKCSIKHKDKKTACNDHSICGRMTENTNSHTSTCLPTSSYTDRQPLTTIVHITGPQGQTNLNDASMKSSSSMSTSSTSRITSSHSIISSSTSTGSLSHSNSHHLTNTAMDSGATSKTCNTVNNSHQIDKSKSSSWLHPSDQFGQYPRTSGPIKSDLSDKFSTIHSSKSSSAQVTKTVASSHQSSILTEAQPSVTSETQISLSPNNQHPNKTAKMSHSNGINHGKSAWPKDSSHASDYLTETAHDSGNSETNIAIVPSYNIKSSDTIDYPHSLVQTKKSTDYDLGTLDSDKNNCAKIDTAQPCDRSVNLRNTVDSSYQAATSSKSHSTVVCDNVSGAHKTLHPSGHHKVGLSLGNVESQSLLDTGENSSSMIVNPILNQDPTMKTVVSEGITLPNYLNTLCPLGPTDAVYHGHGKHRSSCTSDISKQGITDCSSHSSSTGIYSNYQDPREMGPDSMNANTDSSPTGTSYPADQTSFHKNVRTVDTMLPIINGGTGMSSTTYYPDIKNYEVGKSVIKDNRSRSCCSNYSKVEYAPDYDINYYWLILTNHLGKKINYRFRCPEGTVWDCDKNCCNYPYLVCY